MGRRPRGEWAWFITRELTENDRKGIGWDTVEVNNYTKMYWAGPYSNGGNQFYPYRSCGHRYDFSQQADEAILALVLKYPDLLGKLKLEVEFIPESEFEKKKRLKEARERREWVKKALASESTSSVTTPKAPEVSGPATGPPG